MRPGLSLKLHERHSVRAEPSCLVENAENGCAQLARRTELRCRPNVPPLSLFYERAWPSLYAEPEQA